MPNRRFSGFHLAPSALVLGAILLVGAAGVLWMVATMQQRMIEAQAIRSADAYSFALDEFRTYYSGKVADKASANGLVLTHEHATHPRGIPLADTAAIELADQLDRTLDGTSVRLFSGYPFPWREATGGARDEFERDALDALMRDPGRRFHRRETVHGVSSMRLARALVMDAGCVDCHNAHPDSKRKDWRAGDLGGVLAVVMPLTGSTEIARAALVRIGLVLAALAGAALLCYRGVVGRVQRAAAALEADVSEQTLARTQAEDALASATRDLAAARDSEQEATRAKSEFLATMSHELRTPLNAVIGMTSLLQQTPLSTEQREHADVIRHSGDNLLTIINDLIDYSKIESNSLVIEAAPFDLVECVESALDMLSTPATAKGIELVAMFDPAVEGTVTADATRLRQVLVNLLNNAVKFTREGEVTVTARQIPAPAADQPWRIEFEVRDTGIGMPKEQLSRLFKPFSQIDASHSRRYGGTGLGLAISHRLCTMMGGTISARSSGVAGEGSAFSFDIVIAEPVATEPTAADETLVGKRVLIAYGNGSARALLASEADRWGMQARTTDSAEEALRLVNNAESFDALICDPQLPLRHKQHAGSDDLEPTTLGEALRASTALLPKAMVFYRGSQAAELAYPANDDISLVVLPRPVKPRQLHGALVRALDREGATGRLGTSAPGAAEFDTAMGADFPLRILVAEDNMINQRVIIKLLEQMGYRADVAGNGLEAIAALARQRYDVILMDVQMPEMDGIEATQRIVAEWDESIRPRIVALTANARAQDREACLAAGMDDFITKPIRVAHLTAALRRSVEVGTLTDA